MNTIFFSILAGLGFGGSMFFRKLSVRQIGITAFIFEAIAVLLLALVVVSIFFPFKLGEIILKPSGILFSVLGGMSLGIAVVSFLLATKIGGSVIVPSIIAPILGSIIASLLAIVFLGESLSFIKIVGLMLTFVGLYIFISLK